MGPPGHFRADALMFLILFSSRSPDSGVHSMALIRPLALAFTLIAVSVFSSSCRAADTPSLPPVLLQMIRDDSVHRELDLDATQRNQVLAALPAIDGPWFRSRNLPADRQQQEIDRLTKQMETELAKILRQPQQDRLHQLECQALGTRMVLRQDVAEKLSLTPRQLTRFAETFQSTDTKANQLQEQIRKGEKKADDANRELNRIKTQERQSVVGQLTSEQKNKLGSLAGSPFDFSRVKRMYPMAPELSSEGVTWIQGGPLKLEELRGKVVAVHFYAFQCINCQRNFPHYKGWHDDFNDEDLVIIGIQTPETPSERDLGRVSTAVKKDGMEYPVLLDLESSNWKNWSNTMWPTVYLIDKQGFIRRWWQGEMNWQGTPGEKQMRQTIEQLLAESP